MPRPPTQSRETNVMNASTNSNAADPAPKPRRKIGFIGAGNMAGALVGGLLAGGYRRDMITAADPAPGERCRGHGIDITADNKAVAAAADVLVLAVKPQTARTVCEEVAATVAARRHSPLIISIAAGVAIASIRRWLGDARADNDGDDNRDNPLAIVRVMPNTPALIGRGMSALAADKHCDAAGRQTALAMMQSVGGAVWLGDEKQMDAVTAISGSGPAYFFLFIECLIDAARECGLDAALARKLVSQTAYGAAAMVARSDAAAADLRRQVTSPGGTTEQAVKAFMDGGLADLVSKAAKAAMRRSAELSREIV